MKNKSIINYLLDAALLLVLAGMSLSSWVIKFILPCGGGHGAGMHGAGTRQLLGMNRHSWGDIHMYVSLLFLILLTVHVIMHWKMLQGFMKKHISSALIRIIVYFFIIALLIATILPWILYL